jgi:putative nucleotidyltransferase with HDIG domain
MAQQHMPDNIRKHSLIVCDIALCLAKELNRRGEQLNLVDIEASALLHDITKVKSITTRENHAETGALLLRALGYDRVAEIVKAHITTPALHHDGDITEEEIVNYADKRVKHTEVVTLDERYEDLIQRYGKNANRTEYIKQLKIINQEIEKNIFTKLHVSPDDLPLLIQNYSRNQ